MTDEIEITQADRDAAAHFLASDGHPFDRLWHPRVRAGERDDHILVQAFAGHRIEATAALKAENARLRAALEEVAQLCGTVRQSIPRPDKALDVARAALNGDPT